MTGVIVNGVSEDGMAVIGLAGAGTLDGDRGRRGEREQRRGGEQEAIHLGRERGAHVRGEQVRFLACREVPAAGQLAPAGDVVLALGEKVKAEGKTIRTDAARI